MSQISINLSIPKTLGQSSSLDIEQNTEIKGVFEKYRPELLPHLVNKEGELKRFCHVYLNGNRVVDLNTPIAENSQLEVLIPMAGG